MMKFLSRQLRNRSRFLLRDREVNFIDRLKIVNSPRMGCATMKYLLDKRLSDGPNGPYFSVRGQEIYFQPDFPVQNQSRLLDGISQVLVETFYFPDLFTSQVNISDGDIVLDLGGNIGTTSLLFSKLVGDQGRVFTFEPIVYELCKKNIQSNHATNVTVIPKGVSDKSGETEFEVSDFCIDSAISQKQSGTREERVDSSTRIRAQLVSLDEWIEEVKLPRVDFIKVDIEGAEELALRGAEKLIETYKPKWSISSYHQDFTGAPQHPKLVQLLKSFGYRLEEHGHEHIFAWFP